MNTVQLIGRLTRDPEVRYSQGAIPLAVARYTLAVNRAVKKDNEHPHGGEAAVAAGKARYIEADFISCVAFGKSGEFAEKWLKKGMRIGVEGRIQTGTFTDKDGIKRKSFDIIVNKHHFCDYKTEAQSADSSKDSGAAGTSTGGKTAPEGETGLKESTSKTSAGESAEGFYEIDEYMEDDDLPF